LGRKKKRKDVDIDFLDLLGIFKKRSKRSRAMDLVFQAKVPKSPLTWMRHPNRYDWPGIDMGKKKVKRSGKSGQKIEDKIADKYGLSQRDVYIVPFKEIGDRKIIMVVVRRSGYKAKSKLRQDGYKWSSWFDGWIKFYTSDLKPLKNVAIIDDTKFGIYHFIITPEKRSELRKMGIYIDANYDWILDESRWDLLSKKFRNYNELLYYLRNRLHIIPLTGIYVGQSVRKTDHLIRAKINKNLALYHKIWTILKNIEKKENVRIKGFTVSPQSRTIYFRLQDHLGTERFKEFIKKYPYNRTAYSFMVHY